jgi:hypothetical protein
MPPTDALRGASAFAHDSVNVEMAAHKAMRSDLG